MCVVEIITKGYPPFCEIVACNKSVSAKLKEVVKEHRTLEPLGTAESRKNEWCRLNFVN